MKITCVIVTFNRLELLKQLVEAIRDQSRRPDSIVIVDNASQDGTREYLNELQQNNEWIEVIFLDTNEGGAGGFYHGIKQAYNGMADWVWIMDDDCLPRRDTLVQLLDSEIVKYNSSQNIITGFLASRVIWEDDQTCFMNVPNVEKDWLEPHSITINAVKIRSASFVSTLVSREAIRECGFPVKQFFIWFDDVEYTRRISEKFPAYYIPSSIIRHCTQENLRPMDFARVTRDNLWKYRYGLRNQTAVESNYDLGLVRGGLFALRKLYYMIKTGLPVKYILILFLSSLSGIFFKYEKFIEKPVS